VSEDDDNVGPSIKIGGIDIQKAGQKDQRISLLLWGPSGCGKTTLACTAPGKKLLVLFDPDGDASIAERDDVDIADMSQARNSVVEQFKSDTNPLGLAKAIEHYDTIIIDSLTNAQHMAVMHAVTVVKGASIERPSLQGYGHRNALITQLVKNLLRLTAKHNKHVVFIAHEAAPQTNEEGIVLAITIALGGQLVTAAPVDFSEVWHLSDTGKSRRIAIRPVRAQKPMKTRMFATTGAAEFDWKYDEHNISDWFNAWRTSGYKKQPLP
jgi:phage nucleotide-binding protein